MHKVEVVLRLQRLLFANNHNLMLVDSSLDLLEVLLADIVEIYALDRCAELFGRQCFLRQDDRALTLTFEPGAGSRGVIVNPDPVA